MSTDELFIDAKKLPNPLPKSQINDLLDKVKQGDEDAIKIIVEHNIRLVLHQVSTKFKSVEYDKKDLVSIGNIGLMKAVTTFNKAYKVEFSTYAARCIDNEILMFLRQLKKNQKLDSLDRTITHDEEGKELKIKDTISDESDIVEDYEKNITYKIIREIVKKLPDRDREIIMLHFGFYNDKIHTQKEIADMMSISQSYVSRIIAKIVKRIGVQLQNCGLIENYRKSSIDVEESCFGKNERKRKRTVKKTQNISNENNQSSIFSKEQQKSEEVAQSELISQKVENPKQILPQTTSEIEKDDYLKILELMRTPNFGEMLKTLTTKEAVIICLRLGYVDEKYFTTESIAGFLGIETSEVIEATRKVLSVYKENINQFIDKAVDIATGSSLVFKKDK